MIDESAYVVIAGPANTYAHYVTTKEEYAVQRYEGASTIFGPCTCMGRGPDPRAECAVTLDTLDAYIHEYGKLVPYLAPGIMSKPPSDAAPIDLSSEVISLQVSGCISGRRLRHIG